MRAYCGLQSSARGVDASAADQEEEQLLLLAKAMQAEANQHPGTVYLATGEKDLVVSSTHASFLANGVAELANFRQETLNQLSLLMNQVDWAADIRGGSLWQTTVYI